MDLGHGPQRLLLAGCDPALPVLAEALHASGIETINVPCSSRGALEWLKQGRVHAAGSHLLDAATGDYNVPFIRRLFPKNDILVVNFAGAGSKDWCSPVAIRRKFVVSPIWPAGA